MLGDWIDISMFFVDAIVGMFMLVTVAWLVLFRMKELKDCWNVHLRIRYYFGLTIIGIVVNLALGVCGVVYVSDESSG